MRTSLPWSMVVYALVVGGPTRAAASERRPAPRWPSSPTADSTGFVTRRGTDTLFIERARRAQDERGAALTADVVNLQSGRARFALTAAVGRDALISRLDLRLWHPGAAADAPDFMSEMIEFRNDSVYGRTPPDTQPVATRPGALPYFNLVVSLLEQIVRRARLLGAGGPATGVDVPVFVLASRGQTVDARVTPVGADSVTLALAGTELRLRVDATGRVLGGSVPARGIVIERVDAALLQGRADPVRASPSAGPPASAAYDRGRQYTRWLLAGMTDSVAARLSPTLRGVVGGRDGLAVFQQRLAAEAGTETGVVREAVYAAPGATEYYRVSRFTRRPDTTWTTHWGWHGDTVLALGITMTPTPARTAYLGYSTKAPLRLPLVTPPGARWYVAWGGRSVQENYHATATDQRFAYDFVLSRDGALHGGRGASNADYFCFGTPVVAPAAGTVVRAVDLVPDNTPGETNAWAPPGNYVVLDHGGGEFSLIAHFRRGSVRVQPGAHVAAGAVLGECGNSGQSTQPHVHYHLQTGPDYKQGVGLPAFFIGYVADGRAVARGEPVRGQYVRSIE